MLEAFLEGLLLVLQWKAFTFMLLGIFLGFWVGLLPGLGGATTLAMMLPFIYTMQKYAETHDAKLIWEGHRAGREIGYCHIEKLHNLEALPSKGFTVSCFPVKVRGGSAGWTRAVAIIDA